jgi:AcrR family transcriptional regulator
MGTRDKIINAIEEMLAANESVSISAVAAKCGVSHALIHNRYPDLKERIKELKGAQREKRKVADDQELIANLLAKNKALRKQVKGEDRTQETAAFKALLAHVHEVYSMYDSLLEERNRLAKKLAGR